MTHEHMTALPKMSRTGVTLHMVIHLNCLLQFQFSVLIITHTSGVMGEKIKAQTANIPLCDRETISVFSSCNSKLCPIPNTWLSVTIIYCQLPALDTEFAFESHIRIAFANEIIFLYPLHPLMMCDGYRREELL